MTDTGGTLGTPRGDPARPAPIRIGDRDGGVARRLLVRCRIAAMAFGVIGLLLSVAASLRSWDTVSAGLTMIGLLLLVGAIVLGLRARLWSAVGAWVLPAGGGRDATVGGPRLLSPGVSGAPVKRRLGAVIIPVQQVSGPQPGGGALIVHARADHETLQDRDAIKLWWVGSSGSPRQPVGSDPDAQYSHAAGRFVLVRIRDDAVFLATTRLTDTW